MALRLRSRDWLKESLLRSSYPTLVRLMTLRAWILDHLLDAKYQLDNELLKHAEECVAIANDFRSELHFTPYHVGTMLGMCGVRAQQSGMNDKRTASIQAEAKRQLIRSQQMYGSGAAYYEAIAELYHLDDDFNDRNLHVAHAIQMMGSDLAGALLAPIEARTGRSSLPPAMPKEREAAE